MEAEKSSLEEKINAEIEMRSQDQKTFIRQKDELEDVIRKADKRNEELQGEVEQIRTKMQHISRMNRNVSREDSSEQRKSDKKGKGNKQNSVSPRKGGNEQDRLGKFDMKIHELTQAKKMSGLKEQAETLKDKVDVLTGQLKDAEDKLVLCSSQKLALEQALRSNTPQGKEQEELRLQLDTILRDNSRLTKELESSMGKLSEVKMQTGLLPQVKELEEKMRGRDEEKAK